jgi:membrane protein DedA with SNARE-associated domain
MTDAALALALDGGPFALAILLALAAIGLPLPATFALLATGALLASADLDIVETMAIAAIGSVSGDQIGYWIGRLGGPAIARRFGASLDPARRFMDRHGLIGVFLSRFLFTPLGPPINLVAGLAGMAWWRFSLAGVVGEIVWVVAFMGLGALFADRVAALADLAGTFAWFLVAGAITVALGVALWHRRGAR